MPNRAPKETELLQPVVRLFEEHHKTALLELKLGRKRIDVVFVPNAGDGWTAVELKVHDWKRALWQAAVNTQIAEYSYVALWHRTCSVALERQSLFEAYGVGIISVTATDASITLKARHTEVSTRATQQRMLLDSLGGFNQKGDDVGALSLLPA
jgi:hypothetical protein